MNLIKYGIGLLFLLTISCNSDDGIDLRKDKVLVKEIVIADLPNKKNYKENTFIEYNKKALITKIKTDISYYDPRLIPDGTFNKENTVVDKTQTIYYTKDTLIDKIVIKTDSLEETKKFQYNDSNQLISIEEADSNTHFKYNSYGLVDEIKVIDNKSLRVLSVENITYDSEGNIVKLYHNEYSSDEYGYEFIFEVHDYHHSFVNTNINLLFQDNLRQHLGSIMAFVTIPMLLHNFEYVYKGKKAIKTFKYNSIYDSHYTDFYEIIEANGNLVSFYYRKNSNLPDVHVYYNYY